MLKSSEDAKRRLREKAIEKKKILKGSSSNLNPDLVVKYRNYYLQVGTKNISFIKMTKILKDLGIKNNAFFLRLNNPEIANLDPHDEKNLTDYQKIAILNECRENVWYYIREVVRIPVTGGFTGFELHRGNLALIWCLMRNINTAIILPRQNYKTMSTCVLYSWIYLFGSSNCQMSLIHKKYDDSKNNLRYIKNLRENLPKYLQLNDPKDNSPMEYLYSNVTKNRITAKNSAVDAESADKIGRGSTEAIQCYDEFGFIKYNDIIYTAASPAFSKASASAKANGKPYHKLILTTPGDLNYSAGIYAKDFILNKAAKFIEELYDWSIEDVEKYIQTNSKNNFIYIFFSWQQLGHDREWYIRQCREMNYDLLRIRREIDCEWVTGSETSVFSNSDVKAAKEACNQPIGSIHLLDENTYIMNLYKKIDFSDPVLIGVDVASGEYRDSSAITVVDSSTLEVIGVFANNTIDSSTLAQVCHYLLTRVFPNGILVPERNNEGRSMINFLIKTNIRDKIYFEDKFTIGEERVLTQYGSPSERVKRKTRVYGVETTTKTRPLMIDLIRPILEEEPEILHCKELVEEIQGLERKKNGKIEHSETGHDDILFSYLMTRYIWAYGNNLSRWKITKARKFTNLPNPDITLEELSNNKKSMVYLNKTIDIDNELDSGYNMDADNIISEFYQSNLYHNRIKREIQKLEERRKEMLLDPDSAVTTNGLEWDKKKMKKIYVDMDDLSTNRELRDITEYQ